MAKIKTLKDHNDEVVYPITVPDAIKDTDGSLVIERLKEDYETTNNRISTLSATDEEFMSEVMTFRPNVFELSLPEDTLAMGKSAVIKLKASIDVAHVYFILDEEEQSELIPSNYTAVWNEKQDLYSYTKTIKTKGTGALTVGTHTYVIWATDMRKHNSDPVTFTITISE